MKKLILWNFILLVALFAAFAGEAVAVPPAASATNGGSNGFLLALIPVLVPLLVALGKWALPKVPLWILPILAPALGAAVDYLSALATGAAANPLLGAALGSAGVGVREIFDQTKGRLKENPPTGTNAPLLLLIVTLMLPAATISVGVTGCAWLKNTPAETVKYYSFLDSWTLAKAAYDGWSERVVQGKITPENEAKVDLAWNKYRAAFQFAIGVARQDWNAVTPKTVADLQLELLQLIASLTPH